MSAFKYIFLNSDYVSGRMYAGREAVVYQPDQWGLARMFRDIHFPKARIPNESLDTAETLHYVEMRCVMFRPRSLMRGAFSTGPVYDMREHGQSPGSIDWEIASL